jgi:hypothetical protein
MTDQRVPPEVVVPVSEQQPCHQGRQPAGVGQLQDQVEVIPHQAVVIETMVKALAVAGEQTEEVGTVGVVLEDGFACVAAVADMVAGGVGPVAAARNAGHGLLRSRGCLRPFAPVRRQARYPGRSNGQLWTNDFIHNLTRNNNLHELSPDGTRRHTGRSSTSRQTVSGVLTR